MIVGYILGMVGAFALGFGAATMRFRNKLARDARHADYQDMP